MIIKKKVIQKIIDTGKAFKKEKNCPLRVKALIPRLGMMNQSILTVSYKLPSINPGQDMN